jgi:hypothetical protein
LVSCGVQVPVVRTSEIDGDSWLVESISIDEAVRFGALLLRTLEDWTTRGFYYLKPSLVTGFADPKFIYLLHNRRKLRNVLTTLGDKGVLVLGRFTERKALLDGIADRLRVLGYLPIIFDFERPTSLDVTETIKILAGLSLFVVADITNPRSVPLELQATVPDYMVPFVSVVQRGQPVFGMFDDLPNKYDWALPLLEYNTAESLLAAFDEKVVQPALEKVADVRRRKAQPPRRRSAEG